MAIPEPKPGLVLRYDYLWTHEAAAGQDQGKGFGFDPTLGKDVRKQDYWGLRSKLVARPTDNLKITLSGDYYRTDDSTAITPFFRCTKKFASHVTSDTGAMKLVCRICAATLKSCSAAC